jgi:hypothetical protein
MLVTSQCETDRGSDLELQREEQVNHEDIDLRELLR